MASRRGTAKASGRLAAIKQLMQERKTLLKKIGILMVAESQNAFKVQAFDGKQWPERSKVNTAGILSDFAQGKDKPPKRRFETRPALIDTGALRKSIAYKITGATVRVGSALKYAARHQVGGTTPGIELTQGIQHKLAKWLRRRATDVKAKLGWLLNKKFTGKKIKTKVPKRPFVGFTSQTKKTVKKALGVSISKAR